MPCNIKPVCIFVAYIFYCCYDVIIIAKIIIMIIIIVIIIVNLSGTVGCKLCLFFVLLFFHRKKKKHLPHPLDTIHQFSVKMVAVKLFALFSLPVLAVEDHGRAVFVCLVLQRNIFLIIK